MISYAAFHTIENSLAAKLNEALSKIVVPLYARIEKLLEAGEADHALQEVNTLSLFPLKKELQGYVEYLTSVAMLFGASRVTQQPGTSVVGLGFEGMATKQMADLLLTSVTLKAEAYLKQTGTAFILGQVAAQEDAKPVIPALKDGELQLTAQKADPVLHPFSSFMNSSGKAYLNIAASLHTSRVSAYGFTAEAEALGLEEYQINEQEDNRICPVCSIMHGKVFKVKDARALLNMVTRATDPDDLKVLQPWPKQDKASLEALAKMSIEELVQNSWHSVPYHPGPVSDDTEFMSDSGWKLVKDATLDDLAFSLNPVTGDVEWVGIDDVIHAGPAPNGRMVHFSSQNFDLLVTEHHEQPYIQKLNKGSWRLASRPAGELLSYAGITLPRTGGWVGVPCPLSKEMVQLIALWISDGSCVRKGSNSFEISISTVKYQLLAMSLLHSITGNPARINGHRVECNDTALGKYLLGEVGNGCRGKVIPAAIMNAEKKTIRLFLETYLIADGSSCVTHGQYGDSVNNVFYSVSNVLASQLGELIVKMGGFPSYSTQDNSLNPQFIGGREILSASLIHRVRWCVSKNATFGRNGNGTASFVPYNGLTYCLTLERNHIFYSRRNGKCTWTGNCRGLLVRAGKAPPLDQVLAGTVPEHHVAVDEDFNALGFSFSPKQINTWNSVVGLSPVEVVARLSDRPLDQFAVELLGSSTPKKDSGVVSFVIGDNVSLRVSGRGFGSTSDFSKHIRIISKRSVMVVGDVTISPQDLHGKTPRAYLVELYMLAKDMGLGKIEMRAVGAYGNGELAKYGFTPSQEGWEALRADVAKIAGYEAALDSDDLLRAAMNSNDPAAIRTLLASIFGEEALNSIPWEGELRLGDPDSVSMMLAYLKSFS